VSEEFDYRRAVFVLGKIDEILAWEKQRNHERDLRFVDLGRYLCEVRAGQYWRLEKMKSFDEFLERRFPDSRRKAYYLMAISRASDTCSEATTAGDRLDRMAPMFCSLKSVTIRSG
jgi:hypothetical protein